MNTASFPLDTVFLKIPVLKIDGKASDFPSNPGNGYDIPLLTAGIENRGLSRYARREQCPSILSNVISISANGANTGTAFYQGDMFAVLQDAFAIKPIFGEIPSKETGLYLEVSLNKVLRGNYDWSNKAIWNNIRKVRISLPVTAAGSLDWVYMERRIRKIEKELLLAGSTYITEQLSKI